MKWNPSLICCCPSQVLNLQYLRIQIKRQRKLICQVEHGPADFPFWSRPASFLSVIWASVTTSCMCQKPLLYQIALGSACLQMLSSRTSVSVAEDAGILNLCLNPCFIAINHMINKVVRCSASADIVRVTPTSTSVLHLSQGFIKPLLCTSPD